MATIIPPRAVPPVIPPKIAGVSTTPKEAPASSIKSIPEPVPVMKSGDEVFATTEGMSASPHPTHHKMQLIHRHDVSQFFKYYLRCSCGCEAREHSEEAIRKAADSHLMRSFVTENKWK